MTVLPVSCVLSDISSTLAYTPETTIYGITPFSQDSSWLAVAQQLDV